MNPATEIAKNLREVYFGGNWTDVNLKDQLKGLSWEQAVAKIDSINTIAALVYHMHYYVAAVLKVLQGGPLDANDRYSFNLPPIQSDADWQNLLDISWKDAEACAVAIEQLPQSKLWEIFSEEKYGNYYRNLHGIIEHTHYHLGQIALLKKLLAANKQ